MPLRTPFLVGPLLALAASLVVAALFGFLPSGESPASAVPYPEGFRRWAHVKTGIVGAAGDTTAFAGWHHVYANEAALRGFDSGRFDDGAVLVFDRLLVDADATGLAEGRRLGVDVMVRDSARYAATGGWGFERFRGDTRDAVLTDPERQCASCHAGLSARTLVVSRLRP
jgi:hypothetical protein